ncbi:MAG: hypothetical protein ACO1RX_19315 [Candidatus Sericytochromatia bacterium]
MTRIPPSRPNTPPTQVPQAPAAASAASSATLPAPAVLPADQRVAETPAGEAALQHTLEQVQQTLQPSTTPDAASLRRLLDSPRSLNRLGPLLERHPELAQKLKALEGGEAALNLLKTAASRPLGAHEVRSLQRFLGGAAGQAIGYTGNRSGVDGSYGPRTHAALLNVLTAPATPESVSPKPPATPPAAPPATGALPAGLQQAQSLKAMAQAVAQLPASDRARLAQVHHNGQSLDALLTQAATHSLSGSQTKALQSLLVQAGASLAYPGHPTGIDGQFGSRSRQALLQVITQQLGVSLPPAPVAKPAAPRYDDMLADNLLDMTLAVGYDEGAPGWAPAHLSAAQEVLQNLEAKGFRKDNARAQELLRGAGRELSAEYSDFFVKENIGSRDGKPVHAVVRLIRAGDGTNGAALRQAAIEGMNQSDVFAYGGHARYGSGIDFDANFSVTVDWTGVPNAPASGKQTYTSYEELKNQLGKDNAVAIQRLQQLERQGRVEVKGSNEGNIRMSEKMLHGGELGSQLMDRALKGVNNTLSEEIQGDRYRLWLFNGCRTEDYMKSIRQEGRENPQLGPQKLDVIVTEQTLYWDKISGSLMNFVDGVMAQDSGDQLVERLTKANPEQAAVGPTHSRHGFETPRR